MHKDLSENAACPPYCQLQTRILLGVPTPSVLIQPVAWSLDPAHTPLAASSQTLGSHLSGCLRLP